MTSVKKQLIFQKTSYLLMQPCIIEKLGKSPAIFLQRLHDWLVSEKSVGVIVRDRRWVYYSAVEWSKQIYLSDRHIRRVVKKLRDLGLILVNNFGIQNSGRTNWYTIDYDELKKLFPSLSLSTDKTSNLNSQVTKEAIYINNEMSHPIHV
jgi:hypothetical protein